MKPVEATVIQSRLPLPLLRRGKVREVYVVDEDHLLIIASDRVSAFDVVMREPVARKGAVLSQISAFWFERLANVFPSARFKSTKKTATPSTIALGVASTCGQPVCDLNSLA